jgi:hypothetical protein
MQHKSHNRHLGGYWERKSVPFEKRFRPGLFGIVVSLGVILSFGALGFFMSQENSARLGEVPSYVLAQELQGRGDVMSTPLSDGSIGMIVRADHE